MAKDAVIVMVAHSDDQVIGAGGTIAKWVQEGKEVVVVVFSYGVKANPWLKKHVTAEMRYEESIQASEIMGVKETIFFDLTEGKFEEEFKEKAIDKRIDELVKKYKPSKILTHSFDDHHPDHKAVSNILLKHFEKKEKPDIYAFHVWNIANLEKREAPRLMVDITDTFKIKMKALNCFKSQWISVILLIWSIYYRAFTNGRQIKKRYAEAFYKIK